MISFNEKTHEYECEGKVYPSVTQILQDCGLIDISWYTEESAMRGTYVHECLKLMDENVPLVMLDTGPDIKGYIDAYLHFKHDTDYKVLQIEKPYIDKNLRLAGTPDRICTINGTDCILDIKTGQKQEWHGLQLRGYKLLVGEGSFLLRAIYLNINGKYRLESYKDSDYRNIFMCALSLYHWKNK
jgi:hypothetical protein